MFGTRQNRPESNKVPSINKGKAALTVKIVAAVFVILLIAGNSYYTIQDCTSRFRLFRPLPRSIRRSKALPSVMRWKEKT